MFKKTCKVEDVKCGKGTIVQVDDLRVGIFVIDGNYYAVEDVCTHDDGPLAEGELYGDQIECPRHGARFSVRTGAVLSMPAVVPVRAFETKVEDGYVWVNVP